MTATATMRIANAPCSWGVLEFGLEDEAAGSVQVLAEMSQAGFEGTELGDWGFLPTEPAALRDLLRQHGLALAGAFVPVALASEDAHAPGEAQALRVANLLAEVGQAPCLVLADDNGSIPERVACAGRIGPQQGLSERAWLRFAAGAQRIAAAVKRETGLPTVFHHHCGGYIETPHEVELLMQRSDPQLLGLCLDTGHYAYGGGDPLQALLGHGERIRHIHFKDCDAQLAARARDAGWDYFEAVRRGVFAELGQGCVDLPAIAGLLKQRAYQGWVVVEQDVLPGMGTPFDSAQRNRKHLRSLGL